MAAKPIGAALLGDLGALLDAAAVEDHNGDDGAAVLRPPPARRPVTAALLFEGAVAQEGDEAFALERHVYVFELGKAEVATLGDATGGVGVDMAANGHGRSAVWSKREGIEIPRETCEALGRAVIPALLAGREIADKHVQGLDGGNAMALAHDPRAGGAGEHIGEYVAHIGGNHIERATRVPLGRRLEVDRLQRPARRIDS